MAAFFPGQAVVCIRGKWKREHTPPPRITPVKGRVYTVQQVVWCEGERCITLPGSEPYCYEARHFRPIAKPKTSIAIFKRILQDCMNREPAT